MLRPTRVRRMIPALMCWMLVIAGMAWARPAEAPGARLVASPVAGWPQWRGPRRDGVSTERRLLQSWPDGGPRRLWTASGLGRGYSAPIIAYGRIVLTGDDGEVCRIIALDLNGREVWRVPNGRAWTGSYPGSRSSLTAAHGRFFHQNAHGRVVCLDPATGREIWAVDVAERFAAGNIEWGRSESLLVDRNRVIVTVGGERALVAALDARTGATVWTTPALRLGPSEPPRFMRVPAPVGQVDGPSYTSPILVTFAGRRLIVGCSLRHVFCVDAETGELLWTRPMPTRFSVIGVTPVLVGNSIFVTAPDGDGGRLHRLVATGDQIDVREVWTTELNTCHGGVVAVGDAIYGPLYRRRGWVRLDVRTGAVRYTLDNLAYGAAKWADGRLYALAQDGEMALLRPGPTAFEVVGRFRATPSRRGDTWAHPVIHNGRLYLRTDDTLTSYDIRAPR